MKKIQTYEDPDKKIMIDLFMKIADYIRRAGAEEITLRAIAVLHDRGSSEDTHNKSLEMGAATEIWISISTGP